MNVGRLPSGNYGKAPFLMGKLTINGPFSIAMLVCQRVESIGGSKFVKLFRKCLRSKFTKSMEDSEPWD
jgi:hypothetical protein